MRKAICLMIVLCAVCFSQTAYPVIGQTGYQPIGYVPSSSTAIVNHTVLGQLLYLANTSGSSVTVTLTDQSTACSGSACSFWPAINIAANTVYTASLGGVVIVGGIKWSASAGSAVVGYMSYQYPANLVASVTNYKRPNRVLALLGIRKSQKATVAAALIASGSAVASYPPAH